MIKDSRKVNSRLTTASRQFISHLDPLSLGNHLLLFSEKIPITCILAKADKIIFKQLIFSSSHELSKKQTKFSEISTTV
jgi:hypothetical protein